MLGKDRTDDSDTPYAPASKDQSDHYSKLFLDRKTPMSLRHDQDVYTLYSQPSHIQDFLRISSFPRRKQYLCLRDKSAYEWGEDKSGILPAIAIPSYMPLVLKINS